MHWCASMLHVAFWLTTIAHQCSQSSTCIPLMRTDCVYYTQCLSLPLAHWHGQWPLSWFCRGEASIVPIWLANSLQRHQAILSCAEFDLFLLLVRLLLTDKLLPAVAYLSKLNTQAPRQKHCIWERGVWEALMREGDSTPPINISLPCPPESIIIKLTTTNVLIIAWPRKREC